MNEKPRQPRISVFGSAKYVPCIRTEISLADLMSMQPTWTEDDARAFIEFYDSDIAACALHAAWVRISELLGKTPGMPQ